MNKKKLLNAMNHIDDELIKEAKPNLSDFSLKEENNDEPVSDNLLSCKQNKWKKWFPATGCVGVALAGIVCAIWFNSQERIYFQPKEEGALVKETATLAETNIPQNTEIAQEAATNIREESDIPDGMPIEPVTEIGIWQPSDENQTEIWKEENDEGEYEGETIPDIGLTETPNEANGFCYYCYNKDGTYSIFNEDYELANTMTLMEVATSYLEICELSDISVTDATTTLNPEKTEVVGELVSHTPATYTHEIYLTGSTLEEAYLVGLINTIISYSENTAGADFVKLYMDNKPVVLSVEMPEQGYRYMEVIFN